jgi:WD40-like Beta Propeller Repeat
MKRVSIIILGVLLVTSIAILIHHQYNDSKIKILYPWNGALFPIDFASPTFRWRDNSKETNSWEIKVCTRTNKSFITRIINSTSWKPDSTTWDSLQKYSNFEDLEFQIKRIKSRHTLSFNFKSTVSFHFSPDEVGAPILYRTIPIPFVLAEQKPQLMGYSLFNIASYQPPHIALDHFMVCGNCHSFSRDGKTIALDFDAEKRDKGGFFIANVDSVINFDKDNYISWSRLKGHSTFGLFSKISGSGRYIVTTMKDRVVSKGFEDMNLTAYSQLFFPVNGVLVVYDRITKNLWELPGANDTSYVQSNAVWTPDDKYIIFARAKALPYPDKKSTYSSIINDEKLIDDYVKEKRDFKFDLFRVPFNNGKGGIAQPIKGASNNGKSNYFPSVSPDGKWLIFCESNNYMMLRPDSRLFIIPLEGGKAQYLNCNFPSMNSWHAWSPNGKWIVYVSKILSMYTDMFLAHIDEDGNASVPILLEHSKRNDCAANYPEFINRIPNNYFSMNYNYINTIYIQKALSDGNFEQAKILLKKYLEQGGATNPLEYGDLGMIFNSLGEKKESQKYFTLASQFDSSFFRRY